MKKLVSITLSVMLLVSLCSCSNNSITCNSDGSELYFNGYTFEKLDNPNGKYTIDLNNEECIEIAKEPYGLWYMLGAVTDYYGNDAQKPDFIANSRTTDVYLREDLTIDHNSLLTIQNSKEHFSFKIAELTTGETVVYSSEDRQAYATLLEFKVIVEPYSAISMNISVVKKDGVMYLQDSIFSDYYIIDQASFDYISQAF